MTSNDLSMVPIFSVYQTICCAFTVPMSTQPGHPFVGRRNEYRPKGGDALQLRVKADVVLFVGVLCDLYLSALEAFT